MTKELLNLSVAGTVEAVRSGSVCAAQIAQAYFERIEKIEPGIHAYLCLLKDRAMQKAEAVDRKRKEGKPLGRLAGVTVAVKDNLLLEGYPITCGSKILEGYQATYTATVLERLESEDAILVGKTNLDEFAMGSSTENSAFGVTRNPWDTNRVPGGSSGGSSAAVAASMALVSLGSDTGGSIRQPAAFCGIVGLKPTYGAVSRYGLVAFASSLDQIGPMTRNAQDCRAVFEVIAGHDPLDSTSLRKEEGSGGGSFQRRPLRIGIPKQYFEGFDLDADVERAVSQAMETLRKEGFEFKEISLPHTPYALPAYYLVAPSEASANLARYDGMRYGLRAAADDLISTYRNSRTQGFGPEVQRRILIGTFALSHGYYEAYYGKAAAVSRLIAQDFERAFEQVEYILAPTTPTPAFKIGEKSGDPVNMYLCDVFTVPVNLAGIPSISIPCGFSKDHLPIGLQLMGPKGSDRSLLDLSEFFEKATSGSFIRRPELHENFWLSSKEAA